MSNFDTREKIKDVKNIIQQLGNISSNLINENEHLKKDIEVLKSQVQEAKQNLEVSERNKAEEIYKFNQNYKIEKEKFEILWKENINQLAKKISEVGEIYGKPIAIAEENIRKAEINAKIAEELSNREIDLNEKDKNFFVEKERLEKDRQAFLEEKGEKEQAIYELRKKVKSLDIEIKELVEENNSLKDSVSVKTGKLEELRNKVDELEASNKEYAKNLEDKDLEIEQLKEKIENEKSKCIGNGNVTTKNPGDIAPSALISDCLKKLSTMQFDEFKKVVSEYKEYQELLWLCNAVLKEYPDISEEHKVFKILGRYFDNVDKFKKAILFMAGHREDIALYNDIVIKYPELEEFWKILYEKQITKENN